MVPSAGLELSVTGMFKEIIKINIVSDLIIDMFCKKDISLTFNNMKRNA